MNLASPCGPPRFKNQLCFLSLALALSMRNDFRTDGGTRGRSAVENDVDPVADQEQMRRFPVNPRRVHFLFISRCGGSLIRLPWRLPRYTLASLQIVQRKKKNLPVATVFLRRLVWLRAEWKKNPPRSLAVKRCPFRGALGDDLPVSKVEQLVRMCRVRRY